jgi:hypothetical protein
MKRKRLHKLNLSYKAKRRIVFSISVAVLALLFLFRNVSFIILALSSVALLIVVYIADHLFDIRFKPRHYFFAVFIAVTGFLLSDLYTIYPTYDKILHFVLPMMLSSAVLHMILELKLKLNWALIFTFFIVSGSVGIFEIGEYALDSFFDLKLQGVVLRNIQEFGDKLEFIQEPLDDTMIDMSLGMLGSIFYISTIALFYRKRFALHRR